MSKDTKDTIVAFTMLVIIPMIPVLALLVK